VNFTIISKVKEALIDWYMDKGLTIKNTNDDKIVLNEGNNTILVKIIYQDIPTAEEINKELAYVASERKNFNKVYIALPKHARPYIDGKILKKLGIGLILYDSTKLGNFEEILPSIPIRISRIELDENLSSKLILIDELVKEISSIKETVRELMIKISNIPLSKISDIEVEISKIWNVIEELKRNIILCKELEREEKRTSETIEEVKSIEEVPEFLKDNPWVSILSKKSETT